MAFFIKKNSAGSYYTSDGTEVPFNTTANWASNRKDYSSESEANSAISSLGLSGVSVVEESNE